MQWTVNVILRQSFVNSTISLVIHSNMCRNGEPMLELLEEDGYHLSERETSQLAANIKRAIHTALSIHVPYGGRSHSETEISPRTFIVDCSSHI